MESKQYQNIPRTIQNVLLNSKLDAEFIKKTIISSLNEDETAIDLNSYKEHLKNFETRLKDIEEFQKRETRKQLGKSHCYPNKRPNCKADWCRIAANWLPLSAKPKVSFPNGKRNKTARMPTKEN